MKYAKEKDWIQMKIKSLVMAIDHLNRVMKMMLEQESTTLWLWRNQSVIIIDTVLVSGAWPRRLNLKILSKIKLLEQLKTSRATPYLRLS